MENPAGLILCIMEGGRKKVDTGRISAYNYTSRITLSNETKLMPSGGMLNIKKEWKRL